jgi:prefoldin subunit 5
MNNSMNMEMMSDEINRLQQEIFFLQRKLNTANTALELIATPKRSDGTYNRCREACETLAKEALAHSRL